MPSPRFSFDAEVWQHEGPAAWYFVSLPDDVADEIEGAWGHRAAGFGSVRVEVAIGTTYWATSLFPDSTRGTYLLPVKQAVRRAEDLDHGSPVHVELAVMTESSDVGP